MDYEKKYKEALKWIKDVYPTLTGAAKEDAEYYFPELREDEDKKFIPILINGFKEMLKNKSIYYFAGEPIKNIINYLEEQKPIEDAAKEVTKDRESAEKFLKTAGIVDENGNLAKIYRSEQEPTEWSEEDEGELQNAIDCLEYLGNGGVYASESGYDAAKNAVKFLKSLAERFNLQPKQEHCDYITPHKKFFQWIYNRLIDVHHENPDVDYMRSFKERINNLSFDETTHWKPSEKQMKLLDVAIAAILDNNKSSNLASGLITLRKDLEKLM